MPIPPEERLDLRVPAHLKALVASEAEERSLTLNDIVAEMIASRYGLPPEQGKIVRRIGGRRSRKAPAPEESPPSKRRKKD